MRRAFSTAASRRRPLCADCARAAARAVTASGAASGTATRRASRSSPANARAASSLARPSSTSSTSTRFLLLPTSTRRTISQSSTGRAEAKTEKEKETEADTESKSKSNPENETYPFYALFPQSLSKGPPPKGPFEVDVKALRREFLRLQAAAHPDFHHAAADASSASDEHSAARARAEALSARINEAFRTLASPLLRAQYLLRHRFDVDLAGDEATTLGGGVHDAELLMLVLETREDIEAATDEADLDPLREANNARMRASETALAEAFAADDVEAAKKAAVRLRYWVNIDDTLRNWERGQAVVLEH